MEKFLQFYKVTHKNEVKAQDNKILNKFEELGEGSKDFLLNYGGCSFNDGVYTVFLPQDIERLTKMAAESFPKIEGKVICFAHDWLGRFFGLFLEKNQIVLLDPAFSEILEIPANFIDFHEKELVEYPGDSIASDFYQDWLKKSGEKAEYLKTMEYKVYPNLGGKDEIDNLEKGDTIVYWGMLEQI